MSKAPGMWLDYPVRDWTVDAVLSRQARLRPDKVYIRATNGTSLTYAEVHRETSKIANWLMANGLTPGSHLAVFMENEVESLLSHIALTRVGMVSVPLNSSASGGMLAHYLNFSDCRAVIATPQFARRVIEIADDL